jgi:hypothetical protein
VVVEIFGEAAREITSTKHQASNKSETPMEK